MAENYEKVHFGSIQEKFGTYKTKFPERAEKYKKSTARHNKHWVDMDRYAEERLANLPSKSNEIAVAFYKAVVLQRLGDKAPKVSSQDVGNEFWRTVAISMGSKPDDNYNKRIRRWLRELRESLFAEEPENSISQTTTLSNKK